jgi:hypothetical protein
VGRRFRRSRAAVGDFDFGETLEVRLCDLPQRDPVDKLDEREPPVRRPPRLVDRSANQF